MKLFLINLDRHPMRLEWMSALLQGLPFERIAAVDGKHIEGIERRDLTRPMSRENLSRYEKACILSHRAAWMKCVAGADRHCCVLEDDLFISPDFSRFVSDESWLPHGSHLTKIETFRYRTFVSRETVPCLDRRAARLLSLHFGTGAYILSRERAADVLEDTDDPDRTLDRILFDEAAIQKGAPIYQLVPALCVQGQNQKNGIVFPEMNSSIKDKRPKERKTLLQEIKAEVVRPFLKLKQLAETKRRERQLGARCCSVPFR